MQLEGALWGQELSCSANIMHMSIRLWLSYQSIRFQYSLLPARWVAGCLPDCLPAVIGWGQGDSRTSCQVITGSHRKTTICTDTHSYRIVINVDKSPLCVCVQRHPSSQPDVFRGFPHAERFAYWFGLSVNTAACNWAQEVREIACSRDRRMALTWFITARPR